MPIEGKSPETVSQQFCDQLNRLLAKTITKKRLVRLITPENLGTLSFRQSGVVDPAKLSTRFGEAELSVGLLCGASEVSRNVWRLFIGGYKYSITPTGATDPLWRWEYVKTWPRQADRWCRHHVQGDISVSIGKETVSLNRLHLPTGYVTLEEIIRFCIVDLRVKPLSSQWHNTLQESYRKFKLEPAA